MDGRGDRRERGDRDDRGEQKQDRNRKTRAIVDFNWSYKNWLDNRDFYGRYNGQVERSKPDWFIKVLPPAARPDEPGETVPVKHLHSSYNKIKHPINAVKWTPDARRLLTASNSGELTLWNGTAFNFETIMQAHDTSIRALAYSSQQDFLLSADQEGILKYWQTNLNNVKALQAHSDCVRDIAFARGDAKFVTASDDQSLKIWDFATSISEATLVGHNWDVKTVDWHHQRGLLCSGSKDHLVKLWDPRTRRCLTTLHYHKNTVSKVLFSPIVDDWLATASRDQTARIFDLRMMRDIWLLRGHEKEIASIAWHPIHKSLVTTSGAEGSLNHYVLDYVCNPEDLADSISPYDAPEPATHPTQTIYPFHKIPFAHDYGISGLAWHPLGHILATGSNDKSTRFWMRPMPGDDSWLNDRYHLGEAAAEEYGQSTRYNAKKSREAAEAQESEDEAGGLAQQEMPASSLLPGISLPGLPLPSPSRQPMMGSKDGAGPGPGVNGNVTSMNGSSHPMMLGANGAVMPPEQLLKMLQQQAGPGFVPPPLPGFPLPSGMSFPPPFPPVGAESVSFPPLPIIGLGDGNNSGGRKRAPLPSQQESLRAAQRRGERY